MDEQLFFCICCLGIGYLSGKDAPCECAYDLCSGKCYEIPGGRSEASTYVKCTFEQAKVLAHVIHGVTVKA